MDWPNFERAKQYVLHRLERELPPTQYYHSLAHTRDEVVPAVKRLALTQGVDGESLFLLVTAAYFHDLGFVEQANNHEVVSVQIAEDVLPGFGFSSEHVRTIGGIIMATRLPQSPLSPLEEIMSDADLDVLGRRDFFARNQALRAEMETAGLHFTDEQWLYGQLNFMQAHRYFTDVAKALRDARKQENMAVLSQRLAAYRVGKL